MAYVYEPEFIVECSEKANRKVMEYFARRIPEILRRNLKNPDKLSSKFAIETSVEDFIAGGFIDILPPIFASDELDFIRDVSKKFERVRKGLAYFALLSPEERASEAVRLTHLQLRNGWVKTGYPLDKVQTVAQHHQGTKKLATILFPYHPRVDLIASICELHDIGEPVIGDFTPYCDISRADKAGIEWIGIRLMTEGGSNAKLESCLEKEIMQAVSIYDGEGESYAKIRSMVKDCDLLDMCVESLNMMVTLGRISMRERKAIHEKLQDFWDYVGPKLESQQAISFYADISTMRNNIALSEEEVSSRIKKAANRIKRSSADIVKYPAQEFCI